MEEIPLYYSLIIFHKFLYICNFQSLACIRITWGSDPWRFFSTQIRLRNLNRYQATLIQRASYHTLRNSSHTCAFCLSLPGIELHIVNKKGLTVIRLDVCSFDSESCKSFLNVKVSVCFSKFITVDGPVTSTLGCNALSFSLFFNSLPTHLLHYSVLFIYSFNTFSFYKASCVLGCWMKH